MALQALAPPGVRVGYALPNGSNAVLLPALAGEIGVVIAENACKPASWSTSATTQNWTLPDQFYSKADTLGLPRPHWHLVGWRNQMPTWLTTGLSGANWASRLESLVDAMVARYGPGGTSGVDRLSGSYIDVWCETFGDTLSSTTDYIRDEIFYQASGNDPNYARGLFTYIKDKVPQARLTLSDYGFEMGHRYLATQDPLLNQSNNIAKRQRMLEWVRTALDAGIPIDAVAFQSGIYTGAYQDEPGIADTCCELTARGVEVVITQLSASGPDTAGTKPELAGRHVELVLAHSRCDEVIGWTDVGGGLAATFVTSTGAQGELYPGVAAALQRAAVPKGPRLPRVVSRRFVHSTVPIQLPWQAPLGQPAVNEREGFRVTTLTVFALIADFGFVDPAAFSVLLDIKMRTSDNTNPLLYLHGPAGYVKIYKQATGQWSWSVTAVNGAATPILPTVYPLDLNPSTGPYSTEPASSTRLALTVSSIGVSMSIDGAPVLALAATSTMPTLTHIYLGGDPAGAGADQRIAKAKVYADPLHAAQLMDLSGAAWNAVDTEVTSFSGLTRDSEGEMGEAIDFQARRSAEVAYKRASGAADVSIVKAERLDANTLPDASVDLASLSLLAFDQESNLAPVLVPATDVVGDGGGGGAAGGFTTQIQTTSAAFTVGAGLDGIHLILDVAASGTLSNDAVVGTRVALTAASTGTTLVAAGGATYRLKGVDDPGDPARTTQLTMAAAGYYEFEVIRNTDGSDPGDGGSAAEWDVYGLPVGVTTKLSGGLDLNAQTIIPGAPVIIDATHYVSGVRTYTLADSGKSFRISTSGTQRIPAGLGSGWRVTIYNGTSTPCAVDGPGVTDVTLAQDEVCEVMFWSSTRIRVARGLTVGID